MKVQEQQNNWIEGLSKNLKPNVLKVLCGVLHFCHKEKNNEFYVDINRFCDVLGYCRDNRGYHTTRNKKVVHRALKVLEKKYFRFSISKGRRTVEEDKYLLQRLKDRSRIKEDGEII